VKNITPPPTLRVARPSDNLDALLPFYRDGLGLSVLLRFEGHDGFDGLIMGKSGWPYHLEFTTAQGHHAGKAPTKDNLLILYLSDYQSCRDAVDRMRDHGFEPVPSFNPYWDKQGKSFEDPDGYRIVFQQAFWTNRQTSSNDQT
jgi:catechol 2,3-dioxygenase-like lactoylglutathione lyase family enzyme